MASFSPTSFHFFSIILQKTLQYNKLKIPKKIVRRCGKGLRDHVVLKLPCESQWNLGLSKSEDGIMWIDKGWTEFAKHYSIERGHLLVFRYQGNSQFHVIIFDNTTNEIDYPIRIETQNKDKFVKEEPCSDHNSVENHDMTHSRPCPKKTRERSPSPSPRSHKRTRNAQTQPHYDLRGQSASKHKCSVKENSMNTLSSEEKARALNRARGFESPNPFFMIAVQPSHVNNKCCLCVPRSFATSHLGTKMEVIRLKASNERTWPVNYVFKERPKFQGGWKRFVLDNNLRRGDVCVFVMIKSVGSLLFEVSFFRDDNGTANSSPVQELKERKASQFQPEAPFFTFVIRASQTTSKSRCSIPVKFARTYLKRNQGWLSLSISDGKSLSVKYKLRSLSDRHRFELCDGWLKFVRESGLKNGDICTFELTNRDELCFKVNIVKAVDKAHKQRLQGNIGNVKSEEIDSANQGGWISKASNAADKFCSNNPYFRADLRSSHFDVKILRIPISFSRVNLEERTQIVTLQVDDKLWRVKLIYKRSSKYLFSLGWPVFLLENSLHPEDVCVFELIKTNPTVMKVSIFRKTQGR